MRLLERQYFARVFAAGGESDAGWMRALSDDLKRPVFLMTRGQASGGNDVQARTTLLQAVTLARQAGYQRLFLEEGQVMKTLLRHLLPEVQEPGLAR